MLKSIILSCSLGLGLGVLASAPSTAEACMNAIELEGNSAVQRIAKAEKELEQGKLNKARRTLATHRYRFSDKGHRRRAMLVLSAVEFRSAGASTTNYSVTRYIGELERAVKADKDNPLLQSRLAEGYALDKKTLDKARLILNDLDTRDLMPDAFGFRNLAILRAADKDMKTAKVALASCRTLTKRKDVCTLKALDSETLKKQPPTTRSRSASVKSRK
jgi:hypothetical protein